MGKTSVLRELGRRLETEGWVFLFTDVEGATSEKDVIAGRVSDSHAIFYRPLGQRRRLLRPRIRAAGYWQNGFAEATTYC